MTLPFKASYSVLEGPGDLSIHHLGPSLDQGPLPTLFYFALSSEESLTLDPYNQPAIYMADASTRVISFTLPAHGPEFDNKNAMSIWAQEIMLGHTFIREFIKKVIASIDYLIDQEIVDPRKLAAAGLSRGGFIATHLAAQDPRIKIVVGYAPLTTLKTLTEFQAVHSHPLDLIHLVNHLTNCHVRFYIGNRDIRVGTTECFEFIHTLAEAGYHKGHRSPYAELTIFSSIGHKGHGTPSAIFRDGIEWIKQKLNKHNQ